MWPFRRRIPEYAGVRQSGRGASYCGLRPAITDRDTREAMPNQAIGSSSPVAFLAIDAAPHDGKIPTLISTENDMQLLKRAVIVLAPVLALQACQGLSDQDRALLTAANQNAEQAKQMAQQALDAARAAQASANQAASDAKAANEKADRIFQRSLRK
jgi:hypothetical protein